MMTETFSPTPSDPERTGLPELSPQSSESPSTVPLPLKKQSGYLSLLVFALLFLLAILLLPNLARQIAYSLNRGEEEAKAEVARKLLQEVGGDVGQLIPWVVKSVGSSVVGIKTLQNGPRGVGMGEGSGVIVDPEGYLLTNIHVVADAARVSVQLSDGQEISDVAVVGYDTHMDLAVLKITPPSGGKFDAMPWGESGKLEVGDTVIAIGNPFGLTHTVTSGIISAKERFGPTATDRRWQEYLQTDAAINPGNSGGPLVDLRGELVGINTAIVTETFSGVGLAIPSDLARKTYERIRKGGKMEHSWIGAVLGPLGKSEAAEQGAPEGGILVTAVAARSPARKAGLQSGDVIVSIDGRKVADPVPFIHAVLMSSPGTELTLGVVRDRREIEIKVVTEKRPVQM